MCANASKKNAREKPPVPKTHVARQRGYDISTVNAFLIRDLTKRDEEFTNFAIHSDFPRLIGRREIWIDERLFDNEGIFYIANALARLKAEHDGIPEETAYAAGLNIERLLRQRLVGARFRAGRAHKRVPARVYNERYATLPDVRSSVTVWLIDGNLVRSVYKTDYCEGGHGYVYAWVPKGEIWIEHDLAADELPYIVAHEYVELRLMRDEGLDYGRAHAIAAEVEYELRKGGRARTSLGTGRRALTRGDLPQLTAPAFFESIKRDHLHT